MARLDDLAKVEVSSLQDWRDWLAAHHAQRESVWLVTWKKRTGGPHVPASDLVDEALCWGGVDSLPRRLDDDRGMVLMSPRRRGSNWSKVNRDKVDRLTAAGRMQEPGLAKVRQAREDGTWTALDAVETLAVPPDLAAALAAVPEAERRFGAFPPSTRRGLLEWLSNAKTEATRSRRVAELAAYAAVGLRAAFGPDRRLFEARRAETSGEDADQSRASAQRK
jgi:uncharacterized protein YdeI (YjbR/CyaY-like superfamily)